MTVKLASATWSTTNAQRWRVFRGTNRSNIRASSRTHHSIYNQDPCKAQAHVSGITAAIIAVVAFVKYGLYQKLKHVLRRTSARPKEEALPS